MYKNFLMKFLIFWIIFCAWCLCDLYDFIVTIYHCSNVGSEQSDQDYCQSNVILLKASG